MDKFLVYAGGILLAILMIVAISLFSAFTIATLWGWFIVSLGVPAIGYAQAYGIALFFGVLMGTRGMRVAGKDEGYLLVVGIMLNVVALALGGIAVQFM